MSNTRKIKAFVPADVAATARAARCSDCPGKATARGKRGEWTVVLHHAPGCPSYRGTTRGLHADAAAAVARAAEQSGRRLGYERDGTGGLVVDRGMWTSGPG